MIELLADTSTGSPDPAPFEDSHLFDGFGLGFALVFENTAFQIKCVGVRYLRVLGTFDCEDIEKGAQAAV